MKTLHITFVLTLMIADADAQRALDRNLQSAPPVETVNVRQGLNGSDPDSAVAGPRLVIHGIKQRIRVDPGDVLFEKDTFPIRIAKVESAGPQNDSTLHLAPPPYVKFFTNPEKPDTLRRTHGTPPQRLTEIDFHLGKAPPIKW